MSSQNTPILGFYFKVSFQFEPQQSIDGNFQSISGLKASLETEGIAEGGQNWFKHQLPLRTSYQDLVLKRGLLSDLSTLRKWCTLALEEFTFIPINLTISILNEKAEVAKSWIITHAIPISYEISDLNAEESKMILESITIRYNHFKENII